MNTVIVFIISFICFGFLYYKFIYNTNKEFIYSLSVVVFTGSFAIYNFMHLNYMYGLINVIYMLICISDAFVAYDKYFKVKEQ